MTRGRGSGRFLVELLIIAGIAGFDQLTKLLVRLEIPLHDSITVIPGVLNIVHVRNTGAAFGFLNAVDFPFKGVVVALVAAAALMGIALYAAQLSSHERLARAGLALILGGAAGNLIDRLVLGSVVDFIDVVLGGWHFWAFNVADSAITVGVVAMLADMIGLDRHASSTV
ncbi:MAG: signal peptidase II, partial [Rhodospirillaceae bacterium]